LKVTKFKRYLDSCVFDFIWHLCTQGIDSILRHHVVNTFVTIFSAVKKIVIEKSSINSRITMSKRGAIGDLKDGEEDDVDMGQVLII
jgi:hypothetical protein